MQLLWKTVQRFLKKLKIELPYDQTIPLPGIYPNKNKKTNLKRYMHANVHSNIIYNRQDTEATYTHTGILLSHKKERNLAIAATWMDVGSIMLRSQTEKDKYCKKKKVYK